MNASSIGMSTPSAATQAVLAMKPRTKEPADIRWAPTTRHHERAYWWGLMSDNRPEHISRAVLQRLRLRPEGPLLAIHQDMQCDIDTFFRKIARARLSRMPMCQRSFDRTMGHPEDLARLVFEQREDPLLAAAMYALSHDDLLPMRDDADGVEWSSVRFALARCLARLPMPEDDSEECVALAEAALRQLEKTGTDRAPQPELRAAIRVWLDEHRTGEPALGQTSE